MKMHAFYIEEPDLVFGHCGEEKDPKLGLKYFGPYSPQTNSDSSPRQVKIGVVGTGQTITLTKLVLKLLETQITSQETNKWLYPDYPGFRTDNQVNSKFIWSDAWNSTINEYEVKRILDVINSNERIAAASDLITEKIERISSEESIPQAVICALPLSIEEYCGISEKTRGCKTIRPTTLERTIFEMERQGQKFLSQWILDVDRSPETVSKSYDLHNAIKGKAMKFGLPTQILRETTSRAMVDQPSGIYKIGQTLSTVAWNLSTGLFYKASGHPWRLAKLPNGTCYIGISFYRNLRNPDFTMESSMAQVFTHSGEGFVLRGKDVTVDRQTRETHLSRLQAYEILSDAIKKYSDKAGKPNRVVVHKTSIFSEEETKGFDEAIGDTQNDYVAISQNSDFRFLRTGKYPVLRGTVIALNQNQFLLYTAGFTPRVRTYPGLRIPRPLLITHVGDSEISLICSEILGLTKLNWNTTAFATQLPITLEFSQRVGRILSEVPKGIKLQDHYRFYM
jgi:hypothetical protein